MAEIRCCEKANFWTECQIHPCSDEMALWHVLIDQSLDGIVILDEEGRVYESNRKFAEMLGYSITQMQTLSVWDWDAVFSKDQLVDMAQAVDDSGAHLETRHRRKDGSTIDVEISSNGTIYRGKKLIFCICRDISDRKKLERELIESEQRYRRLSIVDELTCLYNSRHFYHQLDVEMNRSQRFEQPLSLILLDIDDFKQFNDAYGHVQGDRVLAQLGQVLTDCARREDMAFRYGGEEFVVLLPGTELDGAKILAEKIRVSFTEQSFCVSGNHCLSMTVSLGVAQYRRREEIKTFIHRTDQAMYLAKGLGKDQVCLAD
nr:sensor domain-containing diguanylate cyclase [uncultured Desulfuromonas sp.]